MKEPATKLGLDVGTPETSTYFDVMPDGKFVGRPKTTKAGLLAELERLTAPMDKKDNCLGVSASYGDMGLWVYQNLDALKEALRDN